MGAPAGGGETGVGRGEKGAAEDEGIEVPAEVFEVPVPLADGGVVRLPLPRKLGRGDAERIAAVVRAWAGTGTATDGNGEKK